MNKVIKSLHYLPSIPTALWFVMLMIVAMLLFLGRNVELLHSDTLEEVLPGFYSHVSNFTLSVLLYGTFGYVGLLFGMPFRYLVSAGVVVIVLNILTELFLSVLNTPDLIDALYGSVGVLITFGFLIIAMKYGLQTNTL